MKRRQFNRQLLGAITAASSVPLLSRCAQNNNVSRNPIMRRISSVEGLLDLSLTAKTQTQVIAGEPLELFTYNGLVPGPILEARSGDTVQLTLINELSSPTNLHYHGLHISPEVDNVFREVAVGDRYTYEFQIPEKHPAVTAWYHPHYHLNVAPQVFGGLAGPLVVRGTLDETIFLRFNRRVRLCWY
ncbi:MAG: multicopper oxidase domain-containing protein [Phormidesmis sp.]